MLTQTFIFKSIVIMLIFFNEQQQKADIINCWALLKRVLGEENVGADGNFVGEPLLEAEYANRRMDPKIKTKFLNGARAFLEEQYVNFMNQLTRSNLKKGQLGGVPTHLSLVRAYMNILFDASTRGFPEQLEVRFTFLYKAS